MFLCGIDGDVLDANTNIYWDGFVIFKIFLSSKRSSSYMGAAMKK